MKSITSIFVFFLINLWAMVAQAVDCPLDATLVRHVLEKDGFRYAFDLKPEKTEVGQPFDLILLLCPKKGPGFDGKVKIDAVMPTHGHGMNYKPSILKVEPGTYRAKGMVLHMPGHWEFRFQVSSDRKKTTLTAPYRQK